MSTLQRGANQDTSAGTSVKTADVLLCDAGSGNTWRIRRDATPLAETGPVIVIEKVDSSGNVIAAAPKLVLDLGSTLLQNFAAATTPTSKTIELRETKGCNEAGGEAYCLTLRSQWYSTPLGEDFT